MNYILLAANKSRLFEHFHCIDLTSIRVGGLLDLKDLEQDGKGHGLSKDPNTKANLAKASAANHFHQLEIINGNFLRSKLRGFGLVDDI